MKKMTSIVKQLINLYLTDILVRAQNLSAQSSHTNHGGKYNEPINKKMTYLFLESTSHYDLKMNTESPVTNAETTE